MSTIKKLIICVAIAVTLSSCSTMRTSGVYVNLPFVSFTMEPKEIEIKPSVVPYYQYQTVSPYGYTVVCR